MGTQLLIITAALLATVSGDFQDILQRSDLKDLPGADVCGFETVQRIIGGTQTRAGEYPWVAALEYKRISTGVNVGIKCGGSVINKRYILTAAHCLFPKDHELLKVWLGVWKISTANTSDKDKVIKFDIEKKIKHESYTDAEKGYDIALLRLTEDIPYTDYIRPICLPTPDLSLPPYGTKLTVAGWGRTETAANSDIKLKVDLPVLENDVCKTKLSKPMIESQMCAGSEAAKDSCTGDSGGPLMRYVTNPNTGIVHWFPHGLVSYGNQPCGKEGIPAVYTRISKFMYWIMEKTNTTLP